MTYLDELGSEIAGAIAPGVLPDGDTRGLFRLYALLALAKGQEVEPSDVHNAWAAWMQERNPDHPSLRSFEELDTETQASDEPFVEAIRVVAQRLEPASA